MFNAMHAALHQYKLRLTNLNQSNRSLKLSRLSAVKDLDLMEAGHANKLSTKEILERIVAGKSVNLVNQLSARDEAANLLDRRLTKIFREVNTINEETGAYDLFLGYPFVEGKFLDGSVARCPVLLFPVRLVRNLQKRPRWRLEVPEGEAISFNKTFFLAYEKFQQIRLPKTFWEEEIEHKKDLQELLNYLYAFFKEHELSLNFNSDLFQFDVVRFADKNKALLDQLELGKLKFQPSAVLGIFPQSDSALVQDYEVLEKDPQAFGLDRFLEGQDVREKEKYIPENQRFFVTPVDQSQEEALLAVKNGRSVVVHGPPGTGKSQVILNLVSDALARGQRVLVCSQKRAALDVVYHRLSELGLGRFVALVHDHRADRSRIFQKIHRQIEDIANFKKESVDLRLSQWEHDFRQDARKIDGYNRFFETLFDALLNRDRFGISPHELYTRTKNRQRSLPLKELPKRFDYSSLRILLDHFRGLLPYLEFFQSSHPWHIRLPFHRHGFQQRQELLDFLSALPSQCDTLLQSKSDTGMAKDIPEAVEEIRSNLQAFAPVRRHFEDRTVQKAFVDFHAQDLKTAYVRRKLDSLDKIFTAMAKFRVLSGFNLTLFQDLKEHVEEYKAGKGKAGSFFSLSFLRARWYLKAILKEKGMRLREDSFKLLNKEFRVLERLVKHGQSFSGQLFFSDLPLTDTPTQLRAWCTAKYVQLEAIQSIGKLKIWKHLIPEGCEGLQAFKDAWEVSLRQLDAVKRYADQTAAAFKDWGKWLHADQILTLRDAMEQGGHQELALKWAKSLEADFEDLRSLDLYLTEFSPDEKAVLDAVRDKLDGLTPKKGKAFLERMENSFFQHWIETLESAHPTLLEVGTRGMPGKRADYQAKVRSRQEKVIQLIVRQLKEEILDKMEFNRLGNPVTYRELGHQVRKKRLLWSVRKLVREFWEESLGQLLPCWMASPESVAAIFPMQRDFFDLVVFDEASQCYVERALPVMLRGRQCVIAGDDKQLPPFDLYSVKVDEYETDMAAEVGVALEVESALDLARNVFQDCHLTWHYRSREEDLINFSNHAFYGGRLKTIPFAQRRSEPALTFLQVEGRWEQNRNLVEARRVVALVEELIRREDPPTVGVVTFNYHQKELIRDEMEARIQELSAAGDEAGVEAFFRALAREETEEKQGIFVKNIENVQGDERDVVIFSVAYARNERGRLVTNFGLLNQQGGENRLNVAVTRARKKIFVVCSFDPALLEVEDSAHPGPKLFKQYLLYARAVGTGKRQEVERILAGLRSGEIQEEDVEWRGEGGLAEAVGKALEGKGWEVARDVGDTNYQVDLAVVDPKGGYLLGVEVEGRQYFSGKTAKEREVYRIKLLENRAWKVVRVWARNHFLKGKALVEELDRLAREELESRRSQS